MFISDGSNSRLWVVDREAWQITGSIMGSKTPSTASRSPEKPGEEGEGADLSATIHKITADRQGNLLLGRCMRGIERLRLMTPV